VVIPIATGYIADHRLCIDHGLRPLVASLGGWTTPTGVYATKPDIADDGSLADKLVSSLRAAVAEALTLAGALATTEGV
jgi:NAD(P)H-dependent FMN reductase